MRNCRNISTGSTVWWYTQRFDRLLRRRSTRHASAQDQNFEKTKDWSHVYLWTGLVVSRQSRHNFVNIALFHGLHSIALSSQVSSAPFTSPRFKAVASTKHGSASMSSWLESRRETLGSSALAHPRSNLASELISGTTLR